MELFSYPDLPQPPPFDYAQDGGVWTPMIFRVFKIEKSWLHMF